MSQEAITYLNEALDILEQHSVKRNIIEWDVFRSETTSSGELVLLAFRGRTQTCIFGEETAGVPTANQGIQLSDGAVIQLTIALGADRTGRTYDGPLVPDEPVKADWTQLGTENDPVLKAATDWLLEKPQ